MTSWLPLTYMHSKWQSAPSFQQSGPKRKSWNFAPDTSTFRVVYGSGPASIFALEQSESGPT